MNNLAMLQQIMKTPNKMQMLRSLAGNNPMTNQLLNQIQAMTPEQQAQAIADKCNEMGITINQLKAMLGK